MVVFDSYYFSQESAFQPTSWQRRLIYPDYKRNRSKLPTAIEKGLPYIKALVSALGISIIEVASTEADDVIGSLVKYCTSNNFVAKIVSADKDFLQLLQESTCVILRPRTTKSSKKTSASSSGWSLITENEFRQAYDNLSPMQYCDVLALMGDTADNIPGVAGIGEKQAVALVKSFGCVETLVENWKAISSTRLREKIFQHRELLLLSKTLVTIHQDLIIPNFEFDDLFVRPTQLEKLNDIMDKLEIKTLGKRVDKYVHNSFIATESLYRKQKDSKLQNASLERREQDISNRSSDSDSSYLARMKNFENLGLQYFYLSTLVNCNCAEEKWEELLSRIRKQNFEVPCVAFWTDYDIKPGEKKKPRQSRRMTSFNNCNPAVFLESIRKELSNEYFSFQDIVMLKGIAISWENSFSIYLDLKNTKDAWIQQLEWLLSHSQLSKASVFVKKQIHILQRFSDNLSLRSPLVDILIGHHATAPFESLSVEQVMKRFALLSGDNVMLSMLEFMFSNRKDQVSNFIERDASKLLSGLLCQKATYPVHFVDLLRIWCQCNWSVLLFRAAKVLNSELMMLSMKTFVEYIEYPLIPVLATMERNGLCLNTRFLVDMSHKTNLATSDNSLKDKWNDELKKYDDNASILWESKDFSFTAEKKYLKLLQRHMYPISGKLHAHYYKSTNLFGKLATFPVNVHELSKMKNLVVASQGFQILVADCSQMEMRILAALSKESTWIQVFLEEGDIHKFIAYKLFTWNNRSEKLSERQFREYAKVLSYGIIRGTSEQVISKELQVSRHDIKSWMELYRRSFSKVLQFLEETSEKSFQRGYSETLLGRKIPVPFKNSQNEEEILAAKKICRRAVIEGTQADIISLAMIRILEQLGQYSQSNLILQVGDQLIFQVAKSDCDKVMKLVKKEVSNILPLPQGVPVLVRLGVGNDWLEATAAIQ
ncbi:5'-3' exonuclease [Galdieria sulphuraria]|nr:5'-3' exonuclease [Galdieria sulphuraria]